MRYHQLAWTATTLPETTVEHDNRKRYRVEGRLWLDFLYGEPRYESAGILRADFLEVNDTDPHGKPRIVLLIPMAAMVFLCRLPQLAPDNDLLTALQTITSSPGCGWDGAEAYHLSKRLEELRHLAFAIRENYVEDMVYVRFGTKTIRDSWLASVERPKEQDSLYNYLIKSREEMKRFPIPRREVFSHPAFPEEIYAK